MSFLEIVLLAVGLSMDSLAVSVTGWGSHTKLQTSPHAEDRLRDGDFSSRDDHSGLPGGDELQEIHHGIRSLDRFPAVALPRRQNDIREYPGKEEDCRTNPLCYKTLCGLGIATSIDALAVGISLACIESAIALEALTIGIVTFLFSAFGVYFGNHFSRKIDLKLDLIGGLILIGIGTKILIEHLYFNG